MSNEFYLIAADIGGTHSRFGLFSITPAPRVRASGQGCMNFPGIGLKMELWLKTGEYGSFRELIRSFKANETGKKMLALSPRCAVIAAAGPVSRKRCHPPNIAWDISLAEFDEEIETASSFLINDFLAQGYACLLAQTLKGGGLLPAETLWAGDAGKGQKPCGVVGAGSGFGKALIIPDKLLVLPSEGGHADFPFLGDEEFAFAKFLHKKYKTVAINLDMVLSGQGFAHLLGFHSGKDFLPEQATALVQALPEPDRNTHAIEQALAWYARFYGRACKNHILETLCLGGLYITGGMAARVPVLGHPEFLQSLHGSAPYDKMLKKIPIRHIVSQQAGLYGTALFGAINTGRQL